jgi:Putative Actinobacterial Holin-X, holin superfamily III
MSQADGIGQTAPDERSTGELVQQVAAQVSLLVRDELKLAQLEMTRKGKQAGTGIGMIGGGGLVAVYGVGCLVACAIIGISHVLTAWLAALIVGAALLAVAGLAAAAGAGRIKKATPPVPSEAVDSVKADIEEVKEKVHR